MTEIPYKMFESESDPRPSRFTYPEPLRLRRIRFLSQLLDQSISLPGGYRIGWDPIIGLIPGVGDLITAALSCYMVLEAYQLGLPKRVILRMLFNIGIETVVGTIPVAGDVFDAIWKSNMRNLNLVEASYHPSHKERSAVALAVALVLGLIIIWIASIAMVVFLARLVLSFF